MIEQPDWVGQTSLLDELANYATEDLVRAVTALARNGAPFTYADALELLPARTQALLRDPQNARHAGNLMVRLKRAKIIRLTGQYHRATHGAARGHVVAEWIGV